MIRFADFMPVPEPSRTKVKFNIRAGVGGESAWDLLTAEDPEPWLDMTRYREKGNSNNDLDNAEYVLAFAQYYPYGPEYYVFGGFFQVEKIEPEISGDTGYVLKPLEQYSEYIKRLIIKLDGRIGRDVYLRWYDGLTGLKNPEIYELAPDVKLGTFPGYQEVRLRHHELQRIVRHEEPSWRDALSSVKGVYVITDLSTGRLYVGSASGEANGLWQRWSGYAKIRNLTGGNAALEEMRLDLGDEHLIEHFQYSILEIFDSKTHPSTILERERFWKLALATREHGLNRN